jgi:predicted CopG family antitoxin
MSKTITIEDDVYDLLASLKEDSRDSFTRVIRRYLPRPCETAGELLDVYEHAPLPKVNWDVLDEIAAGRGRRSGGRK